MNAVHIGDDVWTGLYGSKFIRDYYDDSLDIFDFDTIDDLVNEHIFREI